jgi:hypothetical protein
LTPRRFMRLGASGQRSSSMSTVEMLAI